MRHKRVAQKNPPDKKKEGWDQGAMQHLTLFLSKFWRPGFGTFSLKPHIPIQVVDPADFVVPHRCKTRRIETHWPGNGGHDRS
jgi:hypothetical protein